MERRFFCPQLPAAGETVVLDEREASHFARVLRGRPGERLWLLDGQGGSAEAEALEVAGHGKRLRVAGRVLRRDQAAPPAPGLRLVVAPPRGKLMGSIVRQATELGAAVIQPILCERSVAQPDAGALGAWQQEAVEACKQSGNRFLPRLLPPATWQEVLAQAPATGYLGVVPGSGPAAPAQALETAGLVDFWVGPEGGFTPAEETALLAAGLRPLALSPWVLRVETAVAAGLGCLNSWYRR